MAQTVLGLDDFSEQPQTDTFQQGTGRTTTKSWKGPRAKYEQTWSSAEATQPDSMSGTKGTPAEITATYLPLDTSSDQTVWELIPSPLNRPLASHPAFNISPSQIGWAEKINKANREGRASETDWDGESGSQNLNDYRNLVIKGTNAYRMWSYVVRSTLSTSLANVDVFSDLDAGLVVDWAGIGIPSTVKFSQPVYNRWDGNGNQQQLIEQWLVSPATIRYERQRYTITKEWYGALKWYSVLYNGGSATSSEDGSNVG